MFEISTNQFDDYITRWWSFIWQLERLRNPYRIDADKAFEILQTFEHSEDADVIFNDVVREVRKNLIMIENLSIIENYISYFNKSFDDLITQIRNKLEDKFDETEISLYDDEIDLPYKHLGSYKCAANSHYSWILGSLLTGKEYIQLEFEKETSLRNGKEILQQKENLITHKIKWKGTPAQFAYIVKTLENKGWIDGLTGRGERDARNLLTHFEIEDHNTTPESLGKCFQQLKKDELPINADDAAKFLKFPNRNELKS